VQEEKQDLIKFGTFVLDFAKMRSDIRARNTLVDEACRCSERIPRAMVERSVKRGHMHSNIMQGRVGEAEEKSDWKVACWNANAVLALHMTLAAAQRHHKNYAKMRRKARQVGR